MLVISIDPGEVSGYAAHVDGVLRTCGTTTRARGFATPIDSWFPDMLVVERPQVYPGDCGKANSLITLAMTAGRFLERWRAGRVVTPHPREWKKQVPKEIHNRRVVDSLSAIEAKLLPNLDHNMIDAIGLGRWGVSLCPPRT